MPEACNVIKKETLAHVFPCEFCEISKNTFLIEHVWATASKFMKKLSNTEVDLKKSVKYGSPKVSSV